MQDSPCNAEHLWHQVPALKMPEVPSLSLWQLSALQPTHHTFQTVPREGILAKKWKAGLSRSHTPLLPSQPTKLCCIIGGFVSQVESSGNPTVSCKLFTTAGKGRSPSFKQRHSLLSPLGGYALGVMPHFQEMAPQKEDGTDLLVGPPRPPSQIQKGNWLAGKTAGYPWNMWMRLRPWHNERSKILRCLNTHAHGFIKSSSKYL